ncbi:N-acetyltransferase [Pseudomonas sp. SDI]|uniref:GNAT family N-acetyltransferase n=1 Tax=Pseudomonas sp. SDI TaxID=2170734 RepID=UPI000DE73E0F|nr:GNAT family N-acetyltransferase [Pseudomonas sp. SDI]PWB32368.1 N-acetyltransferase [Pseudomonas sp. SDI]
MIDWLSNHPQHSDTLAEWLYRQFSYEYAEQSLAEWQAEFAQGQRDGSLSSLIAVDGERLLGSASLAADDLPSRPDLGPWLACVFVDPVARGQGLAETLVAAVCDEARARGHQRLYLHTAEKAAYYARRGWQPLQQFDAWGKRHSLMLRELTPGTETG